MKYSEVLWSHSMELQADISRFGDEATLDDNVESFLSQEEGDPRDVMGRGMEVSKGTELISHALFHMSKNVSSEQYEQVFVFCLY